MDETEIIEAAIETTESADEEWKLTESEVIKPSIDIDFSRLQSLEFKNWQYLVTYRK